MDSREPTYRRLQEQVQGLLATAPPSRASGTEHSLGVLQQKWGSVAIQVQRRKVRWGRAGGGWGEPGLECAWPQHVPFRPQEQLSEDLAAAMECHAALQELLEWLGGMEERLGALPSPSGVLEAVVAQIQGQKVGRRQPCCL